MFFYKTLNLGPYEIRVKKKMCEQLKLEFDDLQTFLNITNSLLDKEERYTFKKETSTEGYRMIDFAGYGKPNPPYNGRRVYFQLGFKYSWSKKLIGVRLWHGYKNSVKTVTVKWNNDYLAVIELIRFLRNLIEEERVYDQEWE